MGELRKPAGWRFFDDQFWQKGDLLKCQDCGKQTNKSASPDVRHSPLCKKRKNDSGVVFDEAEVEERKALYGQRAEHPIDAELRRVDKPRPRHLDRGYLAFVRGHACCCCNAPGPSDPHHWSATIRRGVGQKLDDLLTVPLCRRCHDCYHATNALPGRSRAETEMHLLGVQVELLVGWIAERKLAEALDTAEDEI